MKLGYDTKSKDPVYYVQQGIRIGKKVTTKNIARIGKHSELLKITGDPLAYAKEQVAKYNEEAKIKTKSDIKISFDPAKKVPDFDYAASKSTLKNIGYLYLQNICFKLGTDKFFDKIKEDVGKTFDPGLIYRLMICSHILKLDPKHDTFYNQPVLDDNSVMRTADLMYERFDEYTEYLLKASEKIVKRDVSVRYYICGRYNLEAGTREDGYVDEMTGEAGPKPVQYNSAKDCSPLPPVEMGLVTDACGIPLSMYIAPDDKNIQAKEEPSKKPSGKNTGSFIFCGDEKPGPYHIGNFKALGGKAFVITGSVKKLSDMQKQAVFDGQGYMLLSDDTPVTTDLLKSSYEKNNKSTDPYNGRAYKIIEADTLSDTGLNEWKTPAKPRVIITFSPKKMEYQRYIRDKEIERAKKILDNLNAEGCKKELGDPAAFIKKTAGPKPRYELDLKKIAEEEKYDGYSAIYTNLDKNARDIIAISEKSRKTADYFRVQKTDFMSMPCCYKSRERTVAHFMTCYAALLVLRLVESKLKGYDKDIEITEKDIVETLQNMRVSNICDMLYFAHYTDSLTLRALEWAFDMGLDRQCYIPKELNKKCGKSYTG